VFDVRNRFPGLSDGWARFDGPAGTLPVDAVIDAIHAYLQSSAPACTGGTFAASIATGDVVEHAREACGRLLGCGADQVVFGPNATTLMFAYTRALARTWSAGDRIVCTQLDHEANVSTWRLAAADAGAEVVLLPVDPSTGLLDVEPLADLCADGRVRWVAVSGASNLTGAVPDLARVVSIAHGAGARVHVDAVARVPHLPTDVGALGLDSLVTSPYKWFGPHAGVLVLHTDLLGGIEPYRVRPADYVGPERWETGMKNFEALAGVAAAAEFLRSGWAEAQRHEQALLGRMEAGLRALEHVTMHTPPFVEGRAPTSIFTVAGHRPDAVARSLAEVGVAVWSGDNYACELIDALRLRAGGGAVRAGIVRYNNDDDVDRLLQAVADLG
jgi:cysteine desulfurase family protein (TIGR01976 family)